MGEVIDGQFPFNGRIEPPVLLGLAADVELEELVMIGWRKDGSFYFNGTTTDARDISWLLENARSYLMQIILDQAPDLPDGAP